MSNKVGRQKPSLYNRVSTALEPYAIPHAFLWAVNAALVAALVLMPVCWL